MSENTFVVIDVETANFDVSSICQIGAVKFENGVIVDEWETLVNPETFFDYINTEIHGIEEFHVKNSPKFPDVYQKFKERYPGSLLVTYTAFDRSSLNKAAIKYNLPILENIWLDCAKVVRRHWSDFAYRGYGLKNIAEHVGIKFKHHNALEDARTAGLILQTVFSQSNQNLSEWMIKSNQRISIPAAIKQRGNIDGPLFGEVIVFTGTLSMSRAEASEIAAQAGCDVENNVNQKTTVLVVGDLDQAKLAGFSKSSKQRKAEELLLKGQEIKILSEADFYKLVDIEDNNYKKPLTPEKELIFSEKKIVVDSYQANEITYTFLANNGAILRKDIVKSLYMLIVNDPIDDEYDDDLDDFTEIDYGYDPDKKRKLAEEYNNNGGNIIIITHSEFINKYILKEETKFTKEEIDERFSRSKSFDSCLEFGFDCIPFKYIKEKVTQLKRENNFIEAEKILLQYITMMENIARNTKGYVFPWAYDQLSIIYKKMKDREKEQNIIERFSNENHLQDASSEKLLSKMKNGE